MSTPEEGRERGEGRGREREGEGKGRGGGGEEGSGTWYTDSILMAIAGQRGGRCTQLRQLEMFDLLLAVL